LEIEEVERRRRLVEEVGGEVEDMREELLKTVAGAQRRNQGANRQSLPSPSVFDEQKPDGDDYAAFEQQQQVEMMHEQDEALDGVFKTVGIYDSRRMIWEENWKSRENYWTMWIRWLIEWVEVAEWYQEGWLGHQEE
jgi:hypothetical protein